MMSATVGGSPIATCPANGASTSEALARISSSSELIRTACFRTSRPCSVSTMPRPCRVKSSIPIFLEHADLAAQRRLSDPQSVGGLTQAAELGDMDQGAELAEFHWDRIGAYLITKKSLRNSKPVWLCYRRKLSSEHASESRRRSQRAGSRIGAGSR